jgi:hypothetical protein
MAGRPEVLESESSGFSEFGSPEVTKLGIVRRFTSDDC